MNRTREKQIFFAHTSGKTAEAKQQAGFVCTARTALDAVRGVLVDQAISVVQTESTEEQQVQRLLPDQGCMTSVRTVVLGRCIERKQHSDVDTSENSLETSSILSEADLIAGH